ncbi:MAG: tetratricopeptide repeat protein [Planctomycetota bacterium]|jgi:tetratricopeptide (TPR) repeat protein
MRCTLQTLLCFVGLSLACCTAHPQDPFLEAEQLAEDGAFLGALALLDKVPPVHPRYAESRAFAQALERRMRTSQEMVLRGMAMRNEWRDQEAIRHFQQALQIWPGVAGAHGLIQATENRMRSLEQRRQAKPVLAMPGDDDIPDFQPLHTEPVGGELGGEPEPGGEGTDAGDPPGPGPGGAVGDEPETDELRRARQLRTVAGRLERGEMETAVDLLETLLMDFPTDPAVTRTFARVIHQRGLLRYGQGFLEGAIEDWKRVVAMRPDHRQAKAFLKAAETELELRSRR